MDIAHYAMAQQNHGLNGFFKKTFKTVCASNAIADSLEKKLPSVTAEKNSWQNKLNSLKSGSRAKEWSDLKQELIYIEEQIEKESVVLQQEEILASEFGLAGVCDKAKSRRKKAEDSLRSMEKALGVVKGSYTTLQKQQTEGIKRASETITVGQKTLDGIKKQILTVKQKVADYQAERDVKNALVVEEITETGAVEVSATSTVKNLANGSNLPLILGGVFLLGVVVVKAKKFKKQPNKVETVNI